jgi:hypothetical protein
MIAAGCTNAAQLTHGVTINGYSDWYLPSKDEMIKISVNTTTIGGMSGSYWTSTEETQWAWAQNMLSSSYTNFKYTSLPVRAVRAF